MKTFAPDELDFRGLIQELSLPSNLPTSAHLRNHLIAAYAAQAGPFDISKQDQWKTYRDYRKGVQLAAIGNVPPCILRNKQQVQQENSSDLWSVAIVFPTYAPGWIDQSKDVSKSAGIWDNMRLSIWLSSETSRSTSPVSVDNIKEADSSELSMIDYIFHEFVPQSANKLSGLDQEKYIVDLFAINEAWVKVLRKWTEEGDAKVKLTRANPCMTFIKPEKQALAGVDLQSRWQVSTIENSEDISLVSEALGSLHAKDLLDCADMIHVLQVQSSNSLTFPLWYIENRKHISVLVRDRGEDGNSSSQISRSEYPKQIQPGSSVAWAYAHDDLSLASLHVAECYRRLGLGKYCVDVMAEKLIKAQKDALIRSGCDGPHVETPYLLDTEMHKGASRLFFEQQGFKGVVIATWGSITVAKYRPSDN